MKSSFLLTFLAMTSIAMAEDPRITVSGIGTVSAEPDEGYITVGVTVVSPTSAEALTKNSATMQKLYDRLGVLGVKKKDIRTLDFSVGEHYTTIETDKVDRNGNAINKTVKDGYAVSNAIRIVVCELPNFGQILDAVVKDGATQVQNISFGSSKADESLDAARVLAVKDALRKAKLLSNGLGVGLGPVVSVSEGGGVQPKMMYAAASSARVADSVPVSGGTLSFSVSVNVQWSLIETRVEPIEHRIEPNPLKK
jgi:uncharacterized protein YggE